MSKPVDENNHASAGVVHPAKAARLMINMLRIADVLVMRCDATGIATLVGII
jgi:isocitrate lyase